MILHPPLPGGNRTKKKCLLKLLKIPHIWNYVVVLKGEGSQIYFPRFINYPHPNIIKIVCLLGVVGIFPKCSISFCKIISQQTNHIAICFSDVSHWTVIDFYQLDKQIIFSEGHLNLADLSQHPAELKNLYCKAQLCIVGSLNIG